ncbi:MAG: hypothetical protein JWN46_683 [Acidimicrobiales bacterium]|nr:hypothetical protein [Acidimicrobiales bacterium]
MADDLAGVVLAAGAGTRLWPLTLLRPKALCPVAGVALVDLALDRLQGVVTDLAMNAHHGRGQVQRHLAGRAGSVHVSVEEPDALGTAGALGALRSWIDGRPLLVTNADAWLPIDLEPFVDGWDGERVRLLTVRDPIRGDFGDLRYCGVALMPWDAVAPLAPEPSGLYEASWRDRWEAGALDLVVHDGPFVDCGTAGDYLAANLLATGGPSAVGPGATVGVGATLERSVVWPGSVVAPGEVLVDAIRAEHLTILVR